MSYIKELTKTISGQVKELVCDVMKKERTDYEGRKSMLQELPPTYTSPSVDDGRSALQPDSSESEILVNNNPEYWPNIIDRLNTPFDHIERIVLQDFSDIMFSGSSNLFKDGLTFEADGKSGFKGFQVDAGDDWCGTTSNFKKFNDTLSIRLNEPLGGFFVDSFTYTPFVDYSQVGDEIQGGGDERVGVYSDKFLTDYNTGVYDVVDSQIDRNRHILTSNLYELGNLKKDLEDAKDRFRNVVVEQDDKTYIYTFCEHLASLFAKLSNIRMSHEVYGFKHPHTQWEGILALDIWYQLLYRQIDAQYPFDDRYMNLNPHKKEGEQVVWDDGLWQKYKSNSSAIRNSRRENTTPREVLKKICRIVRGLDDMETKQEISDISSGDFAWFEQKGKVYSDFDGYTRFTRYTNLHLGRAYEVMTPREYCELMEQMLPQDGKYIKPDFTLDMRAEVLSRMVDGGFDALVDAFSVVQNEHILNIFNSNTNKVEEFDEDNAKFYSESQCAIVIERVFSRIYSYLQFKSTPAETFQRHINMDSGYKYLTTNSLKGSDHDLGIYYDPEDEVEGSKDYLRYLTKLKTYEDNEDVLDENERAVLKEFNKVLSKQTMDWLDKKWDLCPLLQEQAKSARKFAVTPVAKMVFMSRPALYEEQEDSTIGPWDLFIDFSTTAYMTWEGGAQGNMQFPEGSAEWIPGSNVLHIHFSELTDKFDLSQLVVQKNPTFTLSGEGEEPTTVEYALVGFSKSRQDVGNDFPIASILTPEQFVNGEKTMTIYAAWTSDYIVRFSSDESSVTGVMPPMVVRSNVNTPVPYCRYEYSKEVDVFTYHNDLSLWQDTSRYDTEQVKTRRFGHWVYAVGGSTYKLYPGTTFSLPMAYNLNEAPVLTFTAMWERSVYKMMFTVYGKTYCEVAIDNQSNMVVVPEWDPEPTISNNMFMGWSIPEGSIIGGDESSPLTICGEDGEPIVCGAAKTPVVRGDDEIPVYDTDNEAVVVLVEDRQFNVAFKYIEDGIPKTREFSVPQNYRVPDFHIKNNYESDGHKFRFRYWLLDSGNITSSFTVLSDCVLVAVYDEVEEMDFAESDESDLVDDQQVESASSQLADSTTSFWWCEHLLEFPVDSSSSSLLDSSCSSIFNCGLCGLDPTASGPHFEELWECPYVKMLAQMYGKPTEKDVPNDFRQLSVIDISDVETLLNVLFKINLDIAHNEYFLKIDIPEASNWWYGYTTGSDIMCVGEGDEVVCGPEEPQPGDEVVCKRPSERYVYQSPNVFNWISFEPTVELKFSNFHAANQVQNNKLICTIGEYTLRRIVPVNREIWGFQYNDFHYFYDYKKTWIGTHKRQKSDGTLQQLYPELSDQQMLYNVDSLCLYENTPLQSPTSINDFIRHRLDAIGRTTSQVQTFTSIVKKYRPVIMPQVRDIFQDCQGQTLKYDCDEKNDYGVFGWCSIPSKTMVDMEYNEGALYVPSSYDHHNHVCGSNFMQMDADLQKIYIDPQTMADKASETWCWLYNNRDWTYFMQPFFSRRRNSEVYSDMLDLTGGTFPTTSNHINGVIFEQSFMDRGTDPKFGDMAATCEFLARHHHGENNLRTLSERYVNLISYRALQKLTMLDTNSDYDPDTFNGVYGSVYENLPDNPRFPLQDWIDDYDMTGSYVDYEILDSTGSEILKYKYNLGQSHAIDDFDEDSVWFYITMVEPIEEIDQAVQIEDIMPYVFWWDNRGAKNNGPEVDCYGLSSSAKLNYQEGGWCWSCAHERQGENDYLNDQGEEVHEPIVKTEQKWHAVAHTLGVDFSKEENGNAILTMDNSGNVYKGAFDPNYSGTDEKWKVHHPSNDFGTNQHEDPVADKYLMGQYSNGEVDLVAKLVPGNLNEPILNSMDGRQMVWNLWNVVRHYAYLKYFKNRNRELGSDVSTWTELESYTKKIVKGIYRTFKQNQWKDEGSGISSTFGDVDKIFTNYGNKCLVKWTNSFIEVTSILERNAREHQASLVLFTGDVPMPDQEQIDSTISNLESKYPGFDITEEMAIASLTYRQIMESTDSFRILSLAGMDASEDEDGIRTDKPADSTDSDLHGYFNGNRYGDLPTAYVIGDSQTFQQCLVDTTQGFDTVVDLDQMYPFAEYHLNDTTNKWVRRIQRTVMNKQIIPVYTSMETMTKTVHELTVEDMKSITFQVVPSLYWKYEWSYNDYMIHRVGRLAAPNQDLPMYDMLGNVWELVRDDWSDIHVDSSESEFVNHIVGTDADDDTQKVIKGGAFDQLARNTISPARESISRISNQSKHSKQANVGFRPSMTFTSLGEGTMSVNGPVDLFFLFDASASQDNQIKEMLDAARGIVKIFADGDADKCHVTSALFMGPEIKLMCAKELTTEPLQQTLWWQEDKTTLSKSYSGTYKLYDTNSPYDVGKSSVTTLGKKTIREGCGDWIYTDFSKGCQNALDGIGADGSQSGLVVKFNQFKNGIDWSNIDWSSQPRRTRMSKIQATVATPTTRASGDSGSSSGGTSSSTSTSKQTSGSGVTVYTYQQAVKINKKMRVFTGVPVKEVDGELVFPSGQEFYTYDMTKDGMASFEYPFTSAIHPEKGVLSNWWVGCEPVCDILNKLLSTGVFFGGTCNLALGHAFRPNVPHLVFVFTNEYDNSMKRSLVISKSSTTTDKSNIWNLIAGTRKYETTTTTKWGFDEKEVVVFPTTIRKNLTKEGAGYLDLYVDLNSELNETLMPPDPHCLQLLRTSGLKDIVSDYVTKIGLDATQYSTQLGMLDGLNAYGGSMLGNTLLGRDIRLYHGKSGHDLTKYSDITDIRMRGMSGGQLSSSSMVDINGFAEPFRNIQTVDLLTPDEMEGLSSPDYSELGYNVKYQSDTVDLLKSIDYDHAKTIGYYQLHANVRQSTDPCSVYIMVSDANAPVRNYTAPEEEDITLKHSMFNDMDAIKELLKVQVPSDVQSAIDGIVEASKRKTFWNNHHFTAPAVDNPTWDIGTLVASNLHCLAESGSEYAPKFKWGYTSQSVGKLGAYESDADIDAIFGVKNPYESNNLVMGIRLHNLKGNPFTPDFVIGLPSELNIDGVDDIDGWRKKLETVGYYKYNRQTDLNPIIKRYIVEHISEQAWMNKHVCEYKDWESKDTAFNCWNLDHENLEYFGFTAEGLVHKDDDTWSITDGFEIKTVLACPIVAYVSAGSFVTNHNFAKSTSYVFTANPQDYVTIGYKGGGSLKIVTMGISEYTDDKPPSDSNTQLHKLHDAKVKIAPDLGYRHGKDNSLGLALHACLTDPVHIGNPDEEYVAPYPGVFKLVQSKVANLTRTLWYRANPYRKWGFKVTYAPGNVFLSYYDQIWRNPTVQNFVSELYEKIKTTAPLLMAYRYQSQILDKIQNGSMKWVTEYGAADNPITMTAFPVMDPKKLAQVFASSYQTTTKISGANTFTYGSCVVDLNPESGKYADLGADEFPLTFLETSYVNAGDIYKKDKLLLTRVSRISGTKFSTFQMGSHSSDYDPVTDMDARKYRDPESNPDGAIDDYITVSLGNGGSYQKKQVDVEKNTEVEHDLYAIPLKFRGSWDATTTYNTGDCVKINDTEAEPSFYTSKVDGNLGNQPPNDNWEEFELEKLEKKYQRNKHFFIDPFELTIAQWCYIKLRANGKTPSQSEARTLLNANIREIESSYWKYLSVWEKDEWAQLKEEYKNAPRGGQTLLDDDIVEIDPTVDVRATETAPVNDDEEFIAWLVEKKIYNPLKDTRPYYYATYNEVRGTGQVYVEPDPVPTHWSDFVIDFNKGDEFQMNSRTETESFMDILNNNVVYKTKPRKVDTDGVDGGEVISYEPDQEVGWYSGWKAGINFDLPTEAQWEYCCRQGSTSALPPNYNLGEVFETNHPGLDLIAWYKYKVIGSLPEPERYCAWRISKMLFGIVKDTEQINNVYEPDPRSPVEGRTFNFAKMRGVIDATIATVNALGVGNIINPPI